MTRPMTITAPVNFRLQAKGRRRLESATPPTMAVRPLGRVPRVARLMALALRFAEQVRSGELVN